MSKNISFWKMAYIKLPKEIRDKLENDIQYTIEEFDNNEFTDIMKNCKRLFNYNHFIDLYKSGLISKKALPLMQELVKTNKEIFNSVNFLMFQDDFLKIEKKAFFNIIRYPNICKKLNILKNNYPELFELYVSEVNSIVMENEHISTLYTVIEGLLKNYTLYGQYFSKLNKVDCLKYGLNKYKNFYDYLKQKDLGEVESLEQFLDKEYDKTINPLFENNKKADKKELLFNKYYSISLQEASRLIEQYSEDIEEIRNMISEKEYLTLIEMKNILSLNNVKEIDEMYKNMKDMYSAKNIVKLESSLRKTYAKIYINKFDETRNQIKEQINKSDVEFVEYNGKNIPLVKLKGEAHVLIHSSDSGFKGKKVLKDGSFKKTWEEKDEQLQHLISTTHNDSSFHGVAPINENGVYKVFLPDETEELNLIGNTDINSHIRTSNFISGRAKYLTSDNMSKNSRRVYQEFAIQERLPDAIAIYDDMSNEYKNNAYKAASEFNIPIIVYDKREIVKEQKENIEKMFIAFNESNNVEELKEIISLYETNKAGWLLNRKEQDGIKMDFVEVEISEYLNITSDECKKLIKKYDITNDEVVNVTNSLLNQNNIDVEKVKKDLNSNNEPLRKNDNINNRRINEDNKLIVRNNGIREKAGRFWRKLKAKFKLKFGVERL